MVIYTVNRTKITTIWITNNYLKNCPDFNYIKTILSLPPDLFANQHFNSNVNPNEPYLVTVRMNTSVIDSDNNWNSLLFKEAFHIKIQDPQLIINKELKASRELLLFK